MTDTRHVHLRAAIGKIRTATYNGRDHIVMPVTALVEGVLHAVNSPIPELVLAEEFGIAASSWNGRPVMMDHPESQGQKVSANDPKVLEQFSFGQVFNTEAKNGRLTMDAYLDPQKAEALGGDAVRTLERIKAADPKDPIEVSVGVFMVAEQASGQKNGKPYKAIWRHITPDHLALLPQGKKGACSAEMGCGIRHASVYLATAEGYEEIRDAGDVAGHEFHGNQWSGGGDGGGKKEKGGGRRSREGYGGAPTPKVDDEVKVMGNVAGNGKVVIVVDTNNDGSFLTTKDKKGNRAIYHSSDLKRTDDFDTDEEAADTSERGPRKRDASMSILEKIRSLFSAPQVPSDDEIRAAISVTEETAVEDDPVPDNEKITAAEGCTCHEGEVDMTKLERIKALLAHKHNPVKDEKILTASSDDVLKTLEEHTEKLDAADKVAADLKKAEEDAATAAAAAAKEITDLKTAAAKELTEEEFMKAAPVSLRTMLEKHKAMDVAAHTALVTKLKTAQHVVNEEALKLKTLEQLQEIAALLKVDQPTDYSLRSPRAAESTTEDYKSQPPPDGYAEALAKRKAASTH